MDAVTLLKQDHQTVEELFRRYESDGDAGAKTEIVQQVIRELSIHAAIEEQVLYPEVKDVLPEGDSMADEALHEHQEAKEILAELDRMDAADPEFDRKVRSLIQDVRHHVEEEESEMLPRLEEVVDATTLDELGEKMERAKSLAPTRPHPHAPSTPPANMVAGPMAAAVDRARDMVSDRPEEPPPAPRKATTTRSKRATTTRKKPTASRKKPSTTRKQATTSRKKATTSRMGATASTRKKTATSRTKPAASTRKQSAARRKATTTSARKSTTSRRKAATSRGATGRPRQTSARPLIEVVTDPRGGWRAERQGSARAIARSRDKREVVRRGREVARRQGGRLVVRNADGAVQEDRSYDRASGGGRR